MTIGYIPNFNNKYPFSKKIGQKSFPTSCVMIICSIFAKDNANREKNEMNSFISYSEMQLILYKNTNKNKNIL